MLGHPKNGRRFAARETFSLRWVEVTRKIISVHSKFMNSWHPTRTRRFIGATRRFSKRLCAWRRKTIGPAPSQRSIKCWRTRRVQIVGANCSGITKQDSMRRVSWRTIQNGSLLLLYTKNWPRPEAAGVKKQERVETACAWNIFFGPIDPESVSG